MAMILRPHCLTNAEAKWDMLLTAIVHIGTCSDDSQPSRCRGWIVPFMDELTQRNLWLASSPEISYASGPEITGIDVEAGRLS